MPDILASQPTEPVLVPKTRHGWTVFRRFPPLPSIGFMGGLGVELMEIAGPPAPRKVGADGR